jgi:hypothetical protein
MYGINIMPSTNLATASSAAFIAAGGRRWLKQANASATMLLLCNTLLQLCERQQNKPNLTL